MSGRKNTLLPISIVSSGDMSSNVTSSSVNIQFQDFVSIEVLITGSPTGTLAVEGSHDNVNFIAYPLAADSTITAGSPSRFLIENHQVLPSPYIRLTYTATSGSGTMNATLTARQG